MGTFKNPDVWKQNLAYQIGDFVLYEGSVCMAIKPVPAGTEMSADYWTDFSGGGGDENLSTATVTYTLIDGKTDLFVECACGRVVESDMFSASAFQTEETSGSFTVLLYGGKGYAFFGNSIVTIVSGDAEMSEGEVLITGDCTVTVAPD